MRLLVPENGSFTLARNQLSAYRFLKKSTEVMRWMEVCLEKPFESEDLYENLRDGVALCQLVFKVCAVRAACSAV